MTGIVEEQVMTDRVDAMENSERAFVRALAADARGDWPGAHALVQDDPSPDAAWVHAYLHRKEGDAGNARYWYGRAGKPVFEGDLDEEWRLIADALTGSDDDAGEPEARARD
ncbi:MAG: hypothetical protein KDE35_04570 [Geminicoccaceae bacterium]|nr:hypothetical protein [Geminicoccaceae bacterium]